MCQHIIAAIKHWLLSRFRPPLQVLKDCERKHNTKDSKYETLADAIGERVRDAVGENHWAQARKIQKQLVINQQRKKLKAMKGQAAKSALQRLQTGASPQQKQQAADDAMEAAKAMSALATQNEPAAAAVAVAPPDRDGNATPTRSNQSNYSTSEYGDSRTSATSVDEEMQDTSYRRPDMDGKSGGY